MSERIVRPVDDGQSILLHTGDVSAGDWVERYSCGLEVHPKRVPLALVLILVDTALQLRLDKRDIFCLDAVVRDHGQHIKETLLYRLGDVIHRDAQLQHLAAQSLLPKKQTPDNVDT